MTTISFAAKVETLQIYSPSMKKNIKCVVVKPKKIKSNLPVVYLLHGYSDNYASWVEGFDTKELVDKYKVIAVSPDGAYSSWYLDSPVDSTMRYETFISKELVSYIDNNYQTIRHRNARAITGLSMGGHGALYNAIRNKNVFGAAGSMSGGVDIIPFPENWDLSKRLGPIDSNLENWKAHTVMTQIENLQPGELELIIDCGVDDFFFEVNEKLHRRLLEKKISHRYITDKGEHNITYWRKAQHYHFLFFSQYFNNNH